MSVTTYQYSTWVCGNRRTIVRNGNGKNLFVDPIGLEIRGPKTVAEFMAVNVVDEFFIRIGVIEK